MWAGNKAGRQAGRKDSDAVLHLGTVVFASRKEGPRELRNRTTQSPFPVHQALLPFISTICLFLNCLPRSFPLFSHPSRRASNVLHACVMRARGMGRTEAQKATSQSNQIRSTPPLPLLQNQAN